MTIVFTVIVSVIGAIFIERYPRKTSKEVIPVRLRRDDRSVYRYLNNDLR